MAVFECELKVQFGDVDANNALTMKGALRLMQEAANCHSDQVGYGMNDIERTGYSWVLHQQRCRLYKRPRWNTTLKIRSWSRGAEGLTCLRDFEVLDETGERVAIATTSWLLINAKTLRMSKVPEGMMDEFGTVTDTVFEEPLKRLKPAVESQRIWEYQIQRRDIDVNRHVNNLCYLDYALESLPDGLTAEDVNGVNIMYKKASYLGESISCYGGWENEENKSAYVVAVKDGSGESLHAVVRLERM